MRKNLSINYNLNDSDVVSAVDDLPLWSAPFGLRLLDVVDYRKNIKMLDIGSGNGFPLIELSQRLGPTSQSWGVDPWPEGADRINQKLKTWQINNVEILTQSAEELPFENSFFDLVISNNGINNVQDDKKVLDEIARVSKQKAQLVLTVNSPDSMIEFYNIFEKVLRDFNLCDEIEKMKEHIRSKRKPVEYMEKLVTNAGFKIKELYGEFFQLSYADGTSMLNHFVIKLAFLPSWIEILQPKDVEPVFTEIENELNKIANDNGGLALSIPWICLDCRKE
jgi:arsenite methyltransferase